MGTGRTLRKKPRTRPVKSAGERRRRERVQRRRLVGLGVPPEAVDKMNAGQVREALKRPARIRAAQSRTG